MMDLKYFYIVEINLTHPAVSHLAIAKEFHSQSWLTLTSTAHTEGQECVDNCMKFMKAKAKEFIKAGTKVTFSYAENPHLHCKEEEVDTIDTEGFDENALVSMTIEDKKNEWLLQAAVMVFGVESGGIANPNMRSLH
jgi:hypothetical protein